MNIIIPIAGQSSRFPDMKPKWMLTHPQGDFMVIEAIKGLVLQWQFAGQRSIDEQAA